MGHSKHFDNDWQLIINTAVATELMLMTTFLQARMRSLCWHQHVNESSLILKTHHAREAEVQHTWHDAVMT